MGQNNKIPTILRSKSGPMEKKLAEEFEALLQEVLQRMAIRDLWRSVETM